MKRSIITFVAALWVMSAGCKGNGSGVTASHSTKSPAAVASSATPEELGTLGAEIKKRPNEAHRLLSEHGLNEESFATAIRKVSQDPAASKRYATAFRQASS